jgi:hypothetical protein
MSAPPRRFRFQFSLLALLILVTVVAAFLAGRAFQRLELAGLRLQLQEAQYRAQDAEFKVRSLQDRLETEMDAQQETSGAATRISTPKSLADNLRNTVRGIGTAVGDAIEAGFNDVMANLEISDEVEAGLLKEAMKGNDLGSPATLSLVLIRPSESSESQKESEFANSEKQFKVRMSNRRTKHITHPIGVIVHSAIREGEIITEQSVLQLDEDGKWSRISSQRPPPRK